jgi:hypothetical protein
MTLAHKRKKVDESPFDCQRKKQKIRETLPVTI